MEAGGDDDEEEEEERMKKENEELEQKEGDYNLDCKQSIRVR